MTSIRCKNCNLVNFSTEMQCKRCSQPLNGYSNIAEQRQYQADFEQDYQPQSAPQMSCIKCGGRNRVSLQNFRKDYIPPISYIGFFMGILPGLLLVLILKVKHYLSAPFCGECWQNFSRVSGKETLGLLGCLGGFVGGLFALVLFESVFIMLIFFAAGLALLIRGQLYKSKHSPKYKKIDSKEIIIRDPKIGDVSFAR